MGVLVYVFLFWDLDCGVFFYFCVGGGKEYGIFFIGF